MAGQQPVARDRFVTPDARWMILLAPGKRGSFTNLGRRTNSLGAGFSCGADRAGGSVTRYARFLAVSPVSAIVAQQGG